MRHRFTILILFLAVSVFSFSQEKINIPGFGEIPITNNGGSYDVNFGDIGTFSFEGSIQPLSLSTEASIDQLTKFPGYKMMSNLSMDSIYLEVSTEGLSVVATADTRKKLGPLFDALKISAPTIKIETKIGKGTFELEGELAFPKPIKLVQLNPPGTVLKYSSIKLATSAEAGSLDLSVTTGLMIKPSDVDPELETYFTFGYNLITQEISGAGSYMTKWVDPFGINTFVKPNSIILNGGALEIGYIPGSPTPTKIGIVINDAIFFDNQFSAYISVAPAEKQIGLYATRVDKMTANDMAKILREGFGLKVPSIFPKCYSLTNSVIKFSPTKLEVGEYEMKKGFELSGYAEVCDLLTGDFEYYFDMEDEFVMLVDFDVDIKQFLMNEAKKIDILASSVNTMFRDIEVKKLYLSMQSSLNDMNMNGKTKCEIRILDKTYNFEFEATLDGEEIAKNIINEIIKKTGPVGETVANAAKATMDIANKASGETGKLLADAKTVSKHTHSKGECDSKCVPSHAKKLSTPIVAGSFDAVRRFYFGVFPTLGKVHGDTPEETRAIRSAMIKSDWDKIFKKFDAEWKKVMDDRTYVRFYIMPSSAGNGGNIYRDKVREYRKKELDYRNKVWERMMTLTSTGNERANINGTEIPNGTYYIQSVNAGNSDNGYMDIQYNSDKKSWKIKGQRLQIWTKDNNANKQYRFHRNNYLSYYIITPASDHRFALDCKGGGSSKRTPIHLWSLHKGTSQQFYLEHKGGGKFAIVPKMNHSMCLALVDNNNANKGNKVHLWTYSDHPSKQWYLIDVKTGKIFVPK